MKKYALTFAAVPKIAVWLSEVQIAVSGIAVGPARDEATIDQSANQKASSNTQMECSSIRCMELHP